MKLRALAPALALAVAATAFSVAPANASRGEVSLVEVLAADGTKLDNKWGDFDIVEKAAFAVLAEKPDSAVGVLAKGDVKLTAFVPKDRAFRRLVRDLTGERGLSEKQVFAAVAGLGIDTVETVLLYHVVPGAVINYKTAQGADGAKLTTAAGGTIKVKVRGEHDRVFLRDADYDDRNPRVNSKLKNINKGNKQIAHGINRVLRPIDL
ncbi:MAG: fasciclin domain-containing protein [Nocardioides sp.]